MCDHIEVVQVADSELFELRNVRGKRAWICRYVPIRNRKACLTLAALHELGGD